MQYDLLLRKPKKPFLCFLSLASAFVGGGFIAPDEERLVLSKLVMHFLLTYGVLRGFVYNLTHKRPKLTTWAIALLDGFTHYENGITHYLIARGLIIKLSRCGRKMSRNGTKLVMTVQLVSNQRNVVEEDCIGIT